MSDNNKPSLSYEFFPPKTQKGVENLKKTREVLAHYEPEFYSVTFGAGGTTQENTLQAVTDIQQQSNIPAAPHITCIGSTKESILSLLNQYKSLGINHLVALRGDLPTGMTCPGEFNHASELVSFIRQETGNHFKIAVAAYPEMHPESGNFLEDFNHFKAKMNAGADLAITQYFFNGDSFLRFRDLCHANNIDKPIIPGIMPIANIQNLIRFSEACGAEIPRWIRQSMASYELGSDAQNMHGHEIVLQLIDRLHREDVDGLHFYTMNKHPLVTQLIEDAGLL